MSWVEPPLGLLPPEPPSLMSRGRERVAQVAVGRWYIQGSGNVCSSDLVQQSRGTWGQRPHLPLTGLSFQVQVDEDDFVHIRVFESLPHENKPVALTSYQTNKSRHDELTYF